ncbi:MAG: hypothetical protein ACK522_08920 [Synechococcaceae cyanobacterium]|jgi:hypothetical protein
MREIVFRVTAERPGHLEALALQPRLTVSAPTREEWHHEARETLIHALGPAHVTYRIRLRRSVPAPLAERIPAGVGLDALPSLR